jgi:hypothetical protein
MLKNFYSKLLNQYQRLEDGKNKLLSYLYSFFKIMLLLIQIIFTYIMKGCKFILQVHVIISILLGISIIVSFMLYNYIMILENEITNYQVTLEKLNEINHIISLRIDSLVNYPPENNYSVLEDFTFGAIKTCTYLSLGILAAFALGYNVSTLSTQAIPIQAQQNPPVLDGSDVIVMASSRVPDWIYNYQPFIICGALLLTSFVAMYYQKCCDYANINKTLTECSRLAKENTMLKAGYEAGPSAIAGPSTNVESIAGPSRIVESISANDKSSSSPLLFEGIKGTSYKEALAARAPTYPTLSEEAAEAACEYHSISETFSYLYIEVVIIGIIVFMSLLVFKYLLFPFQLTTPKLYLGYSTPLYPNIVRGPHATFFAQGNEPIICEDLVNIEMFSVWENMSNLSVSPVGLIGLTVIICYGLSKYAFYTDKGSVNEENASFIGYQFTEMPVTPIKDFFLDFITY